MSDESILTSTKLGLGVMDDYTQFDAIIKTGINTALARLGQLGIGPSSGLSIVDKTTTWADFYGVDPRFDGVRSFVLLRTRLLFDPPTTSFQIQAINDQLKELEWTLNAQREDDEWTPPIEVVTILELE